MSHLQKHALFFGKDIRTIERWCAAGFIPRAYRTKGGKGHWRIRFGIRPGDFAEIKARAGFTRKRERLSENVKAHRRLQRKLASDPVFRAEYYEKSAKRFRESLPLQRALKQANEGAARFQRALRKAMPQNWPPRGCTIPEDLRQHFAALDPNKVAAVFDGIRRGSKAAQAHYVLTGDFLSDEQLERAFVRPEPLALRAAMIQARRNGGLDFPEQFANLVGLAMGVANYTLADMTRVFSSQQIRKAYAAVYEIDETERDDDDDVESMLSKERENLRYQEIAEKDFRLRSFPGHSLVS